jgi:hypothetical protein
MSEAGLGGGRCELMSIRILGVSSKMLRKRDWENNLLDIVELGMREALPCLGPWRLKWRVVFWYLSV